MANDNKLKLPKRLYYRLSDAAIALGCMESDLVHWGANSQVEILLLKPFGVCGYVKVKKELKSASFSNLSNNGRAVLMVAKKRIDFDFLVLSSSTLREIDLLGEHQIIKGGFKAAYVISKNLNLEKIDANISPAKRVFSKGRQTRFGGDHTYEFKRFDKNNKFDSDACSKYKNSPIVIKASDLWVSHLEIERLMCCVQNGNSQKTPTKRDQIAQNQHIANRKDQSEKIEFQSFIKENRIIIERTDDIRGILGMKTEWLQRANTTLKSWYKEAMPHVQLKSGNPAFDKT